jgi:hypothetical protein
MARLERNPTIAAKIEGTTRCIGGPLDVGVQPKAASGNNTVNIVRRAKCDDHKRLVWNVILSVRGVQGLARLKREAF